MSTTTWNSDLLSNGSILSSTSPATGSATEAAISNAMPRPSRPRLRVPRCLSSNGRKMRSNSGVILPAMPCGCAALASAISTVTGFIHSRASHGVTTKAIANDSNMPMLALMGMGAMYGPINPETKAMGSSAAITVSVARMVGPPTSSTAPGMICASVLPGWSCWWRWMFSTTTMASSTRMPMEKISANSDTRLSVKPQAREANSVAAKVSTTARPTIAASRRPSATNTSATTEAVANSSFWISFCALSLAVAP